MSVNRRDIDSRVKDAVREVSPERRRVHPTDRFLTDLGFDSLRMVALSLALEDAFERPLLLSDWLGSQNDVGALTVDSLCGYVRERVACDA